MTVNSLYPGFVKLYYDISTLSHVMTIPVLPYEAIGGAWFLQDKSSSVGQEWTVKIDAFVALLRPLMTTGATLNYAELWAYDSVDDDPIFRDSHEIALAGTQGGTLVLTNQLVLTHRTNAGGVSKTYIMENSLAANLKFQPPAFGGNTAIQNLANFINGSTTFIVGRDGSFPIATIKALTKLNDALRRKRNLV